jgi:hypothetical protein
MVKSFAPFTFQKQESRKPQHDSALIPLSGLSFTSAFADIDG